VARWGLLLARTEPDLAKHAGLTCFVVDMHAAGVTVRPRRQMTGQAEFDEVILSGVRVAGDQRLGPVGGGWDVARGTLARERAAIGDLAETRGRQALERAIRLWRERPDQDPVLRDRLTALWIDAEVARLTSRNSPHPAVAKLLYAELNQRIHEFCLTLLGPDALLYDSYAMDVPDRMGAAGDDVAKAFLRSRANTIEAGSSEVLRTLLAERALGLPRDR
jgi:alkylation response protein AidB-like acyl-CoA dehydrogenase